MHRVCNSEQRRSGMERTVSIVQFHQILTAIAGHSFLVVASLIAPLPVMRDGGVLGR
jgi:hypothetical protein